MGQLFRGGSQELLAIAVILALLLAQAPDSGQLGRMSAFFTVLGDILALFALPPDLVERFQGLCSLPAKESDCQRTGGSTSSAEKVLDVLQPVHSVLIAGRPQQPQLLRVPLCP